MKTTRLENFEAVIGEFKKENVEKILFKVKINDSIEADTEDFILYTTNGDAITFSGGLVFKHIPSSILNPEDSCFSANIHQDDIYHILFVGSSMYINLSSRKFVLKELSPGRKYTNKVNLLHEKPIITKNLEIGKNDAEIYEGFEINPFGYCDYIELRKILKEPIQILVDGKPCVSKTLVQRTYSNDDTIIYGLVEATELQDFLEHF